MARHRHGMTGTKLYNTYARMRQRCYDHASPDYMDYGSRGIRICDEWLEDNSKFFQWSLDNGYSEELSIDRIDNNGNYSPENCRWTTPTEQARNRRSNVIVIVNDASMTLTEAVERLGVKKSVVEYYTYEKGFTAQEALWLAYGKKVLSCGR